MPSVPLGGLVLIVQLIDAAGRLDASGTAAAEDVIYFVSVRRGG